MSMISELIDRLQTAEASAERRFQATHDKVDRLARVMIHLVEHIHRKEQDMSQLTETIKADLVALDAQVDAAVTNTATIAADALAAEQADLSDIRDRIVAIGSKVAGMVPAPVVPAVAVPVEAAPVV